ncbi:MAG: winged helix-turn-helix transcriptional regulator [Armatimonadetes bacterium]|nr:winged helix-turn-helix transcriptional regulator [Armatimonadota bacterium]
MATAVKERRKPSQSPDPGLFTELMAKFYRGLGDPTRLRILDHLVQKERTVSELVEILGSPQGRISSHLACLRWCGFVTSRQSGHYVYYRVTDPRVRQLLALGKEMVTANAEHIFACTRIR